MKDLKTIKPLITLLKESQHINSAIALMGWDQETYMPVGAGQARAEQVSF